MSRPWSMRRRIVTGSLVWTMLLMTLLGFVTITLGRDHIRLNSLTHTTFVISMWGLGIVAGFVQVRLGLAPFEQLRAKLASVRAGRDERVTGEHPVEIQALVDDLNGLLQSREQAVRRAQAKAGDLAHGLKTPLAVIAHEAARAEAAGDCEFATVIRQEVDRITKQIDYHLAHARAAASGGSLGASASVRTSADGLVRTLQRLYAERGLAFDVQVPEDVVVRVQREDLDEVLGNLLDNACKWTKSRVTVSATREADATAVIVDDDGPGIPAAMRDAVLQRGVRADEAAPGTGMGLAIVRDLAELYGGSITLTDSPQGGLRATLRLP